MFIAFVHYGNVLNAPAPRTTGVQQAKYDTLDAAKTALADYIALNKSSFQNGYTAYVLDQATQKIVSFATVPQPTLDWQDQK